jgi:hypothetical protein
LRYRVGVPQSAAARPALPPAAWDRFAADAVSSSVQAIERYLAG